MTASGPGAGPSQGTIEAVIDNYVAAWNEPEPAARLDLLRQAVADDCVFEGPLGPVEGREALHAAIADARDMLPGGVVERTGRATVQEGDVRFAWRVLGPDGTRLLEGHDVATPAADGRLRLIRML